MQLCQQNQQQHNTFFCDSCGACCKNLPDVDFLQQYRTANGTCKFLSADNKCTIYETRPDFCRGEYMYEKIFEKYYTREEFNNIRIELCKKLKGLTYAKNTNG